MVLYRCNTHYHNLGNLSVGHSIHEQGKYLLFAFSQTVGADMMYYALRIDRPGEAPLVVRAALPLTEVNGIADISGGVLQGENLEARYFTTTGRGGRLWLDLDHDEIPFFLEIDTHLEDAGLLPPLLIRWVDDNQFRNELRRLGQVRGEVRGTMILDSRQGDFEVSVDVSVVKAIAGSGGRSISKRFSISAEKCCASAADPP